MSVESDPAFNNYLDAIKELVEDNNNYMTPSPLDGDYNNENSPEEEFTTFIFPPEQEYFGKMPEEAKLVDIFLNSNVKNYLNNNFSNSVSNTNTIPQSLSLPNDHLSYTVSMPQHYITSMPPITPASTICDGEEDTEEAAEEEAVIMEFKEENADLHELCKPESDIIGDSELISLPVRQLNSQLKHVSKEEKAKLKSRRRLLKNRGYAQTCRERRITSQRTIIEENQHLKQLLENAILEKNLIQGKYENLKNIIKKAKLEREQKRQQSSTLY